MKVCIKLIVPGVLAAFVLGGFLKIVEQITGETVYVLLLNVDYFPIIKDWEMNEILDFSLHVFVSIGLVIILYWVFNRLGVSRNIYPYVIANLMIGFTLFFTTAFSNRTPDILDVAAFTYWIVGHLIYGVVVGCFNVYIDVKRDR